MSIENNESANPVGYQIVEAITDQNHLVKKVKIKYFKWWQRLLSFLFILPRFRKVYISDPFPGTVYRLLGTLIDLKATVSDKDSQELALYKIVQNNIPLLIDFVAVGIHNKNESKPPQWIYEALNYQFTIKELESLVSDIYRRLDVETFFGITISLRKVQELNLTLDPEVPGDS